VFNALTSEELLVGVGRVLRMAAAADGALEDYQRSQILSAYSVTRLLAAEHAAAAELLAWLRAELDAVLDDDRRELVLDARARVEAARTGVEVGDALVDLLAALPREDPRRAGVHRVLRELIDREVAALARTPSMRSAAVRSRSAPS
jgi:hypothetical protein